MFSPESKILIQTLVEETFLAQVFPINIIIYNKQQFLIQKPLA